MNFENQTYAKLSNLPHEVPINPMENARPTVPPVPVVYYDDASGAVEYRVIQCPSLEAAALETKLNKLGKQAWRLVGILPAGNQVLFVLMRSSRP